MCAFKKKLWLLLYFVCYVFALNFVAGASMPTDCTSHGPTFDISDLPALVRSLLPFIDLLCQSILDHIINDDPQLHYQGQPK